MKFPTASTFALALLSGAALAQGRRSRRHWRQRRRRRPRCRTAPTSTANQIIGNRELPKVLYIVPWKKPLPGDLASRPGGGVLDEALAPIDRDVFRRQISYDAQLAPRSDAAAPAAR